MKKYKVLVSDSIDKSGIDALLNAGFDVDYKPEINGQDLLNEINNYNILIVRSRTKVTREVIEIGRKLEVIARVGVGLDNIDTVAAKEKEIHIINAAEAAMNSVAELAIAHMLCLARSIPFADAMMKKGKWMKKELVGTELKGKYLGIIGLGNIGRNVGRIAKALRMNIIGFDVVPISNDYIKEVGLIKADLKTLIESSDFITCHVPLTPETKHMFSDEVFSIMKPTAFLINTSRGEIIDENALLNALKNKKLAGAALDVYEIEPPVNKELIEMPNVIGTPHIGAQTKEGQQLASIVVAEKIIIYLREREEKK